MFLIHSVVVCKHVMYKFHELYSTNTKVCRSHWPRGLRGGFAVAHLLGPRLESLPEHGYLSVCVVCCQRSLRRADN
jgi:hypothetical protein